MCVYLADTMVASPSLKPRPGACFRHLLDSRNRPGKKMEPAARMLSMVPECVGVCSHKGYEKGYMKNHTNSHYSIIHRKHIVL